MVEPLIGGFVVDAKDVFFCETPLFPLIISSNGFNGVEDDDFGGETWSGWMPVVELLFIILLVVVVVFGSIVLLITLLLLLSTGKVLSNLVSE